MAKHEVKLIVPERPIGNADVEFPVKKGSNAFGRLKVSKGGIEWVPKDCTYGHHLTWDEIDSLAVEHGRKKN